MHKQYANKQLKNGTNSYKFNFPKNHDGGKFNYDGLLDKIFHATIYDLALHFTPANSLGPACYH